MQCFAGGAAGIDVGSNGERFLGIHMQEGVNAAVSVVDVGNPVEVSLDQFNGGNVPGSQFGAHSGRA